MGGSHMDMAVLCAGRGQQSAQLDHLPCEGAPVPPSLLGFMQQDPADDLGHRTENLGYAIREAVITQNIPLREAAHNGRVQGIDHAADPALAYAIGAHRAWLDVAVEGVAAEPLPTDRPLHLRKSDDLRVAGHVAISH